MAMIKCPECGQRISSMAMTCPHCGVAIKGHLHECPECGEWCLDSQKECPECGAELKNKASKTEDTESQDVVTESSAQSTPTPEPENKQHYLGWVIFILIVLIAFGGGWGYVQYQIKLKNDAEQADSLNRMRDEMENAEVLRIQQQDTLDWQKALEENTVTSIERYMSEHPEGAYIEQASELKNKLVKAEVTDEDKSIIRTVIESELSKKASAKKSDVDKDVIGVHYSLGSNMKVTKVQASDGSFQFNIECSCTETLTRSDPTKEGSRTFVLRALLDADKNILEINI